MLRNFSSGTLSREKTVFPSSAYRRNFIVRGATPPHSVAQSRNPAAAVLKEEAGYEKLATFNSAIGRTPVTFH